MEDLQLFTLHPPDRDRGTLLYACTPGLEMPTGILRIPGYREKIWEVKRGEREPFWGTAYAQDGRGRLADLVRANSMLFAASESLKHLLEEAKVEGVRYFPIEVDHRTTMHILGVRGQVGLQPAPLKFMLLDGAEIGMYNNTFIYVSARIARLIEEAKLDLLVEPAQVYADYTGFPFTGV